MFSVAVQIGIYRTYIYRWTTTIIITSLFCSIFPDQLSIAIIIAC